MNKIAFLGALAFAVLLSAGAHAACHIPTTFLPHTALTAEQLNDNFSVLAGCIDQAPATVGETSITAAGALCNGSTDDSAIIRSVVSVAQAAGGTEIVFPAGKTCAIASTVPITSNGIRFICKSPVGVDKSQSRLTSQACRILWTGAQYGKMFSVASPYGSTANYPIQNFGMNGFTIDGNGKASLGLDMWTLDRQRFDDMSFTGFILGVPSPMNAPVLTQTAGGPASPRTLYVVTTYTNPYGETIVSPESNIAVLAGNAVVVTTPSASGNASGWNVYISTVSGSGWTLQNSTPIAIGTNWTEPSGGEIAGISPPTTNYTGQAVSYRVVPAVNGTTFGTNAANHDGYWFNTECNQYNLSGNCFYFGAYSDGAGHYYNTNEMKFFGIHFNINGSSGSGMYCHGCDNMRIYDPWFVISSGTIPAMDWGIYQTPLNPVEVHPANGSRIYNVTSGAGSGQPLFVARGQDSVPACQAVTSPTPAHPCTYQNWLVTMDKTNGTPDPVIETGASLSWSTSRNEIYNTRLVGDSAPTLTPGLVVMRTVSEYNICIQRALALGILNSIYVCALDNGRILTMDNLTGSGAYWRFDATGAAANLQLQASPGWTGAVQLVPKVQTFNNFEVDSAGIGAVIQVNGANGQNCTVGTFNPATAVVKAGVITHC